MNGDAQIFATSGLKQITREQFDELEMWLLAQPQVEAPVSHSFFGGLYVREGKIPAGTLALGHEHKAAHHCVILKGRMTLLTEDGTVTEIVAPCAFVGNLGRKLVFVHEDVVGQNIHAMGDWPAECHSDIDAMEMHLYNRSKFWQQNRLANSEIYERVEQEQQQQQFGLASAAAVVGIGATTYGVIASQHAKKTANDQAKNATAQQAQAQQLATVEGEAQQAIDTANAATKKWEYIAIGGIVLIVVGGVIYAFKRKK